MRNCVEVAIYQMKNNNKHLISNENEVPDRIIFLLTIPRSGSTWLLDNLRCHPYIDLWPEASLYVCLNLESRRYPTHLSNNSDCSLEIEIAPGIKERIPDFRQRIDQHHFANIPIMVHYAIEKLHPDHFKMDHESFCMNIKKLRSNIEDAKFIFLVRDPKAAIGSFWHYQKRSPKWYQEIDQQNVFDYYLKTYKSILSVSREFEGLVIDYSETLSDMQSALNKIFKYLWEPSPSKMRSRHDTLISSALKATDRTLRLATGSPFLGNSMGAASGCEDSFKAVFDANSETLDACYKCYDAILK